MSNKEPSEEKGMISLEREERMAKIFDLKLRGISPHAIAKALNINVKTVYEDLRKLGEKYRDQIAKTDPLSMIAEHLIWLEEMKRVALHEMATASKKIQKVIDPNTGTVTEIEVADPNKAKYFTGALKAEDMILKLKMDTGVIPRDPEKLFQALQRHEEDSTKTDDGEERSPEEIQQAIEELIKKGRRLR